MYKQIKKRGPLVCSPRVFGFTSSSVHGLHSLVIPTFVEPARRAAVDASVWEGPLSGPEDYLTSRTLRKVGVLTTDTRDGKQHRFISLGLDAEHTLRRSTHPTLWFWKFSKDALEGKDCCSTHWVVTHYITASQMYAIDRMRKSLCPVDTSRWPYLEPPEAFYSKQGKQRRLA